VTRRLLTGGTGFVGGAIALELLDRTDDELFCLVRAADDEQAQARLRTELTVTAQGYGRPDLAEAVAERAVAVRGDITLPGCGVRAGALPAVDETWHCAASLQYEEKHREAIEAQNVRGTANVLALSRAAGVGVFNQVSTAYVAGSTQGTVPEGPAPGVEACNNCYESSKVEAERLVLAAADEMRVRVLRPSIVIGHSVTRHAINFSGMYGFARQVLLFRRTVSRRLGTFLAHTRVRLIAEPGIEANLVPVDQVARNAVAIGLSSSPATFFHLTNAASPTVGAVVTRILNLAGLREPLWVDDRDGFTSLDEKLDEGMDFYRSYLRNGKRFDRTNTDAVCGEQASTFPIDDEVLTEFLLYYLRQQTTFTADELPERVLYEAVN
jgi:nucleoside-diphosphate-sugar epimerase